MAPANAIGRIYLQEDLFLRNLQEHVGTLARVISTERGDWIVKGFIDVYKRIYTISIDTKVVSKVLELLLFPELVKFGEQHGYRLELSQQQNFYPDVTFISETGTKYAVDIKSTYRIDSNRVNGLTLGAFTGYFRDRTSTKNTRFPYAEYSGHYVLGVIYSKGQLAEQDERKIYKLEDLERIGSVIKDFTFFVQPKWRIASALPGSGNTKNIGSVTLINQLLSGTGPFSELGEEVYDDYWMFYLTEDMAKKEDVIRPYMNFKTYTEYKNRAPAITLEEAQLLDEQDSGIAPQSGEVEVEGE
jgi:hypothetical protein